MREKIQNGKGNGRPDPPDRDSCRSATECSHTKLQLVVLCDAGGVVADRLYCDSIYPDVLQGVVILVHGKFFVDDPIFYLNARFFGLGRKFVAPNQCFGCERIEKW